MCVLALVYVCVRVHVHVCVYVCVGVGVSMCRCACVCMCRGVCVSDGLYKGYYVRWYVISCICLSVSVSIGLYVRFRVHFVKKRYLTDDLRACLSFLHCIYLSMYVCLSVSLRVRPSICLLVY